MKLLKKASCRLVEGFDIGIASYRSIRKTNAGF
jgi:hypothetical protein